MANTIINLLTSSMTCIPINIITVDTMESDASYNSMPFSHRDVPMMLYTFHHSV